MREQVRIYRQTGEPAKALAIVRAELAQRARARAPAAAAPRGSAAAHHARPRARGRGRRVPRRARLRARSDRGARRHRGTGAQARAVGRARARVPRCAADAAQHSRSSPRRSRRSPSGASSPRSAAASSRPRTTPAEKAQRAAEIAQLYENELGDLDGAIRMLDGRADQRARRRAPEGSAAPAAPDPALGRDGAGARARAADGAREPSDAPGRRSCSSSASSAPTSSIASPTRSPRTRARSNAIRRIRSRSSGSRRCTRSSAASASSRGCSRRAPNRPTEPIARAQLLDRVAGLRANRGDIDGAIAAYLGAFTADPTNREVFTAMERVCYKAERWAAAMQLYETAIAHVEGGQVRAARIGSAICTRAAATSSSTSSARSTPRSISYQKVVEVDSKPEAAVKVLEDICRTRDDWQPLIAAWERRAETQKEPGRRTEALRHAAALATDRASDPRASVRLNRKLLTIDPSDALASATLERYYEETQDRSGPDRRAEDAAAERAGARDRRHAQADRARVRRRCARRRDRDRALPEDPRAPARESRRARGARPDLRIDRAVGRADRGHAPPDQGHERSQHEGAARTSSAAR